MCIYINIYTVYIYIYIVYRTSLVNAGGVNQLKTIATGGAAPPIKV